MSIRKRGSTWWIDFTTPGGARVRQSSGSSDKAAAQELHDRLRNEAWRVARLADRKSWTWDEAALRYLEKFPDRNKATHIKRFTERFSGRVLESLTDEEIVGAFEGLAKPYNFNRHASTLKHLFRLARDEWKWTGSMPQVPKCKEPKRRVEFLKPAEAKALVDALPSQHRDLVRFALATGLRLGNILGLTWQQIDVERQLAWIHPDQAKARRAIAVPLNATAIEVLARQETGVELVFPRNRIETKVWKKAVLGAGITRRIRFHDLRHTWASWHMQDGTPAMVLQELGGWASYEMVRRYAHLQADHLAAHAGNIEAQLRHSASDSSKDKVT